jgi:hypothetical protein
MTAFLTFMKGLYGLGPVIWAWLSVVFGLNAVVPLVFWYEPVAILTFVVFKSCLLLGIVLTHRFGFEKILGLMHFPWFLLIPYLLFQWGQHPLNDTFGLWLRAVVTINAICLAIDVVDVVTWFRSRRVHTD